MDQEPEPSIPDWGVGHYEPTAAFLAPAAQVLVGAAGVVPGERVIDLGCGTGNAYAILNDISARDYQNRTTQWLQGKTFERTTPIGPWLVTPDEIEGQAVEIACDVDGQAEQRADVSDLLFDPAFLVSYVSSIVTLEPGDVIATGTPAGVGAAQSPPQFLSAGQTVVTRITGLGGVPQHLPFGVTETMEPPDHPLHVRSFWGQRS